MINSDRSKEKMLQNLSFYQGVQNGGVLILKKFERQKKRWKSQVRGKEQIITAQGVWSPGQPTGHLDT